MMRTFPEVSATIIVPQYDGDAVRLDGVALYDYLTNKTYGDHSVTFLIRANHNFFNRYIDSRSYTNGSQDHFGCSNYKSNIGPCDIRFIREQVLYEQALQCI